MVIYSVPEADRALRDQLRKKLSWEGFGPLSSSVWVSRTTVPTPSSRRSPTGQASELDIFRSRSVTIADRDLAARAWDLDTLNQDYDLWLNRYQTRLPVYRANRGQRTGGARRTNAADQ